MLSACKHTELQGCWLCIALLKWILHGQPEQSSPDGFWMFLVLASHPQPHQPQLSDPHCTSELTPGLLLLEVNAKIRFNRFNFNGVCCTLIELALLVKLNRSTTTQVRKRIKHPRPFYPNNGALGAAFRAIMNAPKFSRSTNFGAMKIRPTFPTGCRNLGSGEVGISILTSSLCRHHTGQQKHAQLAFSEYQPSHAVGMQTHRTSRLLALHSLAQMDPSWPAGAEQS